MTWVGIGRSGPVIAVLFFSGCSAPRPATPEAVAAVEARLMSPYEQSRVVMSDELTIEISANFYADVTRPALDPQLHERTPPTKENGDEIYRWTSRGGSQSPLKFSIRNTQFLALSSATLRVRGSGKAFALNATAVGNVIVSGKDAPSNCREVRIEDGVFQRK